MSRSFIAAIALLVLSAPGAPAGEKPAVEDLVARLHSRVLRERAAAADAIVDIGADAVPAIVPLLDDPDARVQGAAVEILVRIGTPESVKPILQLLDDSNPSVRDLVHGTFLQFGRQCRRTLRDLAKADVDLEDDVRKLLEDWAQDEIEKHFASQITANGDSGFYHGQFDALRPIAEDVSPVLLRMFQDPAFQFRDPGASRRARFRQLAGEALGELGSPEVIPDLQRIAGGGGAFGSTAAYSLYRLGDREPVERMEKDLLDALAAAPAAARGTLHLQVAELYSRIGEHAKAADAYQESIRAGASTPVSQYNLACNLAMMGKKKEALAALRRAIDLGYSNAEWLQLDRDLESLHDEPEFRKMVGDLGGSPADVPSGDPGKAD